MIKTNLNIKGMMCHNCEARMTEAIKMNFDTKEVSMNFEKDEAVVVSEEPLDELKLKVVVAETGFSLGDIKKEEI